MLWFVFLCFSVRHDADWDLKQETFNAEMLLRYQTLDLTGSSLTDNISSGLYPLP